YAFCPLDPCLVYEHRLLLPFLSTRRRVPRFPLFPYTTLFRSAQAHPTGCVRFPSLSLYVVFPARVHVKVCSNNRTWALLILHERSEEHTSELQSRFDLVCRLLLEKKNPLRIVRLNRDDLALLV